MVIPLILVCDQQYLSQSLSFTLVFILSFIKHCCKIIGSVCVCVCVLVWSALRWHLHFSDM